MADQSTQDFVLIAKCNNAPAMAGFLSTLSMKKDQQVTVEVRHNCIKLIVEESRAILGVLILNANLFEQYVLNPPEERQFVVSLSVVLECLQMAGPGNPMGQGMQPWLQFAMKKNDPNFLIVLQHTANPPMLIDCILRTFEAEPMVSISFRAHPENCRIVIMSETLKEAFNDLDWSSPYCTWFISNEHPYLRITTESPNGTFEVELPHDSEAYDRFEVTTPSTFRYKLKHFQPCAKALSLAEKSQIRINSAGVISLQHLLHNDLGTTYVDYLIVPLDDEAAETTQMDV